MSLLTRSLCLFVAGFHLPRIRYLTCRDYEGFRVTLWWRGRVCYTVADTTARLGTCSSLAQVYSVGTPPLPPRSDVSSATSPPIKPAVACDVGHSDPSGAAPRAPYSLGLAQQQSRSLPAEHATDDFELIDARSDSGTSSPGAERPSPSPSPSAGGPTTPQQPLAASRFYGYRHIHILPFNPQANGTAEAAVKRIKLLLDRQTDGYKDWHALLPLAQHQLNSTDLPRTLPHLR